MEVNMETVNSREIPLIKQEKGTLEKIVITVPQNSCPFRDDMEELKYHVVTIGGGREYELFESIMDNI